jgi:hypothetical protein
MNSVIKKYGAGIGGFLIVVLTAVSAVKEFDLATILQLVALTASTVVSVGLVGLLKGKWPGAVKTGVDLLGAAIALVLPFAIAGFITWDQVLLVIIGFIKAAATEFGVQIRTDSVLTGEPGSVVDLPAVAASETKVNPVVTPASQ